MSDITSQTDMQSMSDSVPLAPVSSQQSGVSSPKESTMSKAKKLLFLIIGSVLLIWGLLIGVGFTMVGEGGKGNSGLAGLLGLLSRSSRTAIDQFTWFVMLFFLVLAALTLLYFLTYLILNSRTLATDPLKSERKIKTIISGVLLALIIIGGLTGFLFLSKQSSTFSNAEQVPPIVTDPRSTLDLSAPIAISFDATGFVNTINIQKYKIISYLWDFGDNTTGTGMKISHEYIDKGRFEGVFNVTLEVTLQDASGSQTTDKNNKWVVSIKNVKPNVVFTATPDKGSIPLTVAFDGSDSKDVDGQITKVEWDLNADGKFDDGNDKTAKYTYTANGKYDVALRLTDNSGETNTLTHTVDVSDIYALKGVIDIATETSGKLLIGKSYLFDASKSSSPNGKITKYSWDFGDTTGPQSGRTISHAYQSNGSYVVTLTITDENGASATKTRKITVGDASKKPTSNIVTTPTATNNKVAGAAPFTVKFDASKSTDQNSDIVSYAWDFNSDGTPDKFGESVTNIFPDKGTYDVQLTLTDSEDNQIKSNVTVEVTSPGIQAKINATPITGVVPLTVKFDASGSTYLDGTIISYIWDFGDGTPKRQDAAKISYKYTKIGTYTANVTVIGSDGKKATEKQTITVQNVPVKSCFTANKKEATAPANMVFNANCSTGTIAKYNWDLDGNGLYNDGAGPQTSKTFTDPGTYTIGLEVTDTQGVVDTFTDTITVTL